MILLQDLLAGAAAEGARLDGPAHQLAFEGFAHDSRNVRGGEMFVAVRTERADGHDYIADARRRGAAGVLCERLPDFAGSSGEEPTGVTCVVVRDTRAALRAWARYVLRRQSPLVIGVTGGVGKTSTTRAVATLLRHLEGDPRAVFHNDNFNDLFGLPISLSALAPAHQTAVLELASDSAGEIEALCHLTEPRWGVVTNVAPTQRHVFATAERLGAEYGALAERVSGRLFLNADDHLTREMAARAAEGVEVTTFGVSDRACVRATDVHSDPGATGGAPCLTFRLHSQLGGQGSSHPVACRLLGRHSVYTALAAAAVALARGHELPAVAEALSLLEPAPGRLNPLPGLCGARLVDDTFSASVPSTLAALDVLADSPPPRIFVLGAVSGAEEPDQRAIGERAAGSVEHLVLAGDGSSAVARAAIAAGLDAERVSVTHTAADTAARVRDLLVDLVDEVDPVASSEPEGCTPEREVPRGRRPTVLLKGAEPSRLERVVERLLDRPPGAGELVRQAPGARQVVPLHQDRAAWMEVDLGAIAGNLSRLRRQVAPATVMAVLKADAYGHGALRVARTAIQHGAAMLGTAVLSEAATLRAHGISAPILVLGYTPAWQARDVARLEVAVCLYSRDLAQSLSRAALALQRPPVSVHLKVDTGMHRLGLLPDEVLPFAQEVRALPGVRIEGLFTHFATADDADLAPTRRQLQRFVRVLEEWERAGLPRPRYVHAANSAAALRLPESRFDLVRTGIALYGLRPSPDVPLPEGFRPALALKTQLAQVHDLPAGEPVSYGGTWVAPRPSRIGVLPIGYADGFRRGPRTWGEVLLRGRRVPLVGRVCMDMSMVDVTDVPGARAGDEVVLIGSQEGEQGPAQITADEVAARLGTSSYEVVSQILARIPREVTG
jgi:alanine racemase